MAYVKPYTYVDGTVLSADNHHANEHDAKKYINQQSRTLDLADESFGTPDLALGELQPITNHYVFPTGEVHGLSNGITNINRAYYTSNVKAGNQTSNTLEVWTTLFETADSLELEKDAEVLVTWGGTFFSSENTVRPNGLWDSKIWLRLINEDGEEIYQEQTRAYSFEEYEWTGAPSGNFSPFGNSGTPNLTSLGVDDQIKRTLRRWVGFHDLITLTAGRYKLSLVINAKVEQGFTSARSFTTEIFYK